jgi:hypothetical protein
MAFSHANGIDILLNAFAATSARFPAEIYNQDENAIALGADESGLSELARGLRYAARQRAILPATAAARYETWLRNAAQLADHLARGTLAIDPLVVHELPTREKLIADYGIGRGEAACLVLAQRYGASTVFLSSDTLACHVAIDIGIPYLTLQDMLNNWVTLHAPSMVELEVLLTGMSAAKFQLPQAVIDDLKGRITR